MTALALAILLGRNPILVTMVWQSFPADRVLAVALVEYESGFNARLLRPAYGGSTDWGLFQLNSAWHPQYRGNLAAHIREGAGFLLCLMLLYRKSGDATVLFALAHYQSGKPWSRSGLRYAQRVFALAGRLGGCYASR
jgi:hypothetical protein